MKRSKNSVYASSPLRPFATSGSDNSNYARRADIQIKSATRSTLISNPVTREMIDFVPSPPQVAEVPDEAPNTLASHMRQLRRRKLGAPRWLVLAVLMGGGVAMALVRLLVR
jgi:hypothetical protein